MKRLITGAKRALKEAKIDANNIVLVRVPGSFEIPQACDWVIRSNQADAVIALGAIQKGETNHDEIIAHAVAKALQDLMRDDHTPIGFGVVTFVTDEQGLARSADNEENRGYQAAKAVLEMVKVRETIFDWR